MLEQLNVVTKENFMPLVTNQVHQGSPILEKIFGIAQEGDFGMGTPSLDGRAIIETLDIGSVNEEAATPYTTGTVSVNKGSTTVTGAGGASFTSAMGNRGAINITDGAVYKIKSITDATHLELEVPFEQANVSGKAFSIDYFQTVAGTSGSYGRSDTFVAGDEDTLAGAAYTWKMYQASVKIHNLDVKQNAGKNRIIDLAAQRLMSATKQLKRNLVADFYSAQADGGNGMIGIRAICAGSGTVGTINKQTYAWWQGYRNVAASTARDLSWDLLNDAYYATKTYGNGDPASLIVTSDGVIQNYENNLTKTVVTGTAGNRYESIVATRALDEKTVDAGLTGFKFKGIDMISDPLIPVLDKAFFINLNYIFWRVLQAFQSTGWQDLKASQNKDWMQLTINGYGALTTNCCSKFGVIEDLSQN